MYHSPTQTSQPAVNLIPSNMSSFIKRKDLVDGRCSGPKSGCKKHPRHKQSPGVCSLCLIDKLSRLSAASRRSPADQDAASSCSSSSASSCYSSSNPSSCASPVVYRNGFTTSFLTSGNDNNAFMGKSRSVALLRRSAKRNSGDENDRKTEKMKVNGGFLSKFIFPRSKRKDHLHHQAEGLLV